MSSTEIVTSNDNEELFPELEQEEQAALVRRREPVEAWLATLSEHHRSAVLEYAAGERSVVLSYLYASLLGLELSIDLWEEWLIRRYRKLDHRAILETEIMALTDDISKMREQADRGGVRRSEASTKIAYLTRELRGHIEHMSKEVGVHDRRTLLIAGVELTAKQLKKVFGRNAQMWPAIEAVLEAVFTEIEVKHQM